jgi:hypothetical protein
LTKEKPTEFGPGMGDAEKETDAIELGKYRNAVGCYRPSAVFDVDGLSVRNRR